LLSSTKSNTGFLFVTLLASAKDSLALEGVLGGKPGLIRKFSTRECISTGWGGESGEALKLHLQLRLREETIEIRDSQMNMQRSLNRTRTLWQVCEDRIYSERINIVTDCSFKLARKPGQIAYLGQLTVSKRNELVHRRCFECPAWSSKRKLDTEMH
jgi:hypothetical protein